MSQLSARSIPYGIADFKRIRNEGYMQAEFGHIRFYMARPEMELARGRPGVSPLPSNQSI